MFVVVGFANRSKRIRLKVACGLFHFLKDSTHRELFLLRSLIPLTDTHLYTEIRMVDMTGGICGPFAGCACACRRTGMDVCCGEEIRLILCDSHF